MNDRLGLPSASGFERLQLCPGSWQLEKDLPDMPSDDSTRGDRIHAALHGGPESTAWAALEGEEMECAERCWKLREEAIQAWSDGTTFTEHREQRLYLHKGIRPIFSGQPDVLFIQYDRALVLDFKSGFGEQTESAANPQLAALAVLARANHPQVTEVTVGIIQPYAGGPVELTKYITGTLALVDREARKQLEDANQPNARIVPGLKQCSFCKAGMQGKCPGLNKTLDVVANTQLVPSESLLAQSMEPADLADFVDRCSLAARMAEKGKAWAQAIIATNPERYASHFTMEETSGRDSIEKLDVVHQRMIERGVPTEHFMRCLTARKAMSKTTKEPGLETVLKAATGLKGKPLKDALDECLAGCIREGETKKTAVRIGAIED